MRTNDWLRWTVRKVASQSPATLLRRLGYAAQKGWADRAFPTPRSRRRASIVVAPGRALREEILGRPAPRWHWNDADIAGIARSVPAERQARTIAHAEALVARRFSFRGLEPLTLPPGEWTPRAVGVGWISCLNRHHWFATLGFAYRYSHDARFLQAFVRESASWMDHHLGRLGRLEWDAPFEVAGRINAWVWAHFLFAAAPQWATAHYDRFLRGLGLLAEYLNQTIEYHSPGNHVLLEAKAMVMIGEVFPEFAGAAAWRRKGWSVLTQELDRQICSDGVHVERSTMYHRIIAGEVSELWLFCRNNGHPEAPRLEPVVRRMAEFQRWIDQGDGALPLFADAHAEDTYCRFSAPAAVATVLGADGRALIHEPTDHGYWLVGRDPSAAPAANQESTPAARSFPEGGYFVVRSGWGAGANVLVWDCGPTGYHLNRKHAHLDTLSFTLSIAGTPILIDPGKGTQDRRQLLRGTRAHTTVCVDGEEQGVLAARDEIWSAPGAELELWATSSECAVMIGRHDGYRRLPQPVWHVRSIVVMHGLYWLVVDHLEGFGRHLAEQRFHFAPGVRVEQFPERAAVLATKGAATLSLHWSAVGGGAMRIRLEPGVAEQQFGQPQPTTLVTALCSGPVPLGIAAVGVSGGSETRVSWEVADGARQRVVVYSERFEHQIRFGPDAGELALPGGWTSDAKVVVARARPGSPPHDLLLVGATHVERDGEERGRAAGYHGVAGVTRLVLD